MINAPRLLTDLTRQLKRLEADLRQRISETADVEPGLRSGLLTEWQTAREAQRCAETFEIWADQVLTQAAVHWLLSGVFLRFIEDNQLVERPWLAGTPESGRLALARDRHEAYFQAHPLQSDHDYLLAAFQEAGRLPGLHTFFDAAHNPVFRLGISGDAAMALRQFWQQIDPDTGRLVHDFSDPAWNTHFLGDLYQDLSEATRKRYALLQTPEFVEEFILDRTLTPALHEFGLHELRMIDPTCGSGHFLLGGFHRLVAQWQRREPGRNPVDIAQKALDAVAGVDLNPFAVAITRFRLLVAALSVAGVQRLSHAPDWRISVAIGDSLLHGTRFGLSGTQPLFDDAESHAHTGLAHAYASEDLADVQRILGRQYHAVVGNPPYIVVKDAALNAAYRGRYKRSCHRQYSLGVPFTERFFDLAVSPADGRGAGYVGLITANSFMKREFGSKLIEQVLPRLDLTHVVDTSGAYLPGHGTPTVILFGRNQAPVDAGVRTVMGIKEEPSAPDEPAQGLVWRAIVEQIDRPDSESDFVSVADTPRLTFGKHPWSIGGGGASELRDDIEAQATRRLKDVAPELGFGVVTREDDAYVLGAPTLRRAGVESNYVKPAVEGESVRDWSITDPSSALWPYITPTLEACASTAVTRLLWRHRTGLADRVAYGKTQIGRGLQWFEYSMFFKNRFTTPLTISFAEIATHNHFVMDRGGKVFNRTAPVIKLPADSSEDDHLGLLGLLNSSVACFWLKQVCQDKAGGGIGRGIQNEPWEARYAFNASNVAEFPLPDGCPVVLATHIDRLNRDLSAQQPATQLAAHPLATRASLNNARDRAMGLRKQMIALQEVLDWHCYHLYSLLPPGTHPSELQHPTPIEVALGERAFEIVLARRMAAGREQTTWFERHGATPITEIPAHWPEPYRQVVARRIDLIERDKTLALIERPEYKRRWNAPKWEDLEEAALRDWLLDHLEAPALWPASADHPPQWQSTARLAEAVLHDTAFMQVAALYAHSRTGQADFDLPRLVADLVAAESVPLLPVQRYTDSGLRKRQQWQGTWALQRAEDRIDAQVLAEAPGWREELQARAAQRFEPADTPEALQWVDAQLQEEIARQQAERKHNEVGAIPVPPKYQSKDFLKTDHWRLRGGLDVPKERRVSLPGCERGADGSLPIAWAGWNHLQQATALAGYYMAMKDGEGWEPARLQPLLAGLLELLPWLEQWHNEPDPVYGERMGHYYQGFVSEEARALGVTLDHLRAWQPVAAQTPRGRKKRPPEPDTSRPGRTP